MIPLFRAVLFLCLAAAGVHAADPWTGRLVPAAPGPFPLIEPFTGEFRFGWSNIDAADATAKFTRQGNDMIVDVSGGTLGLARTLWKVDASHHAVLHVAGLQPVAFDQVEKYAKRTTTTRGEFRADGLWRLRQTTPGPKKDWKHIKIDPLHDMITGMLFIRSQPLADHDHIALIIYPGDTAYFTEITVVGREQIKIGDKFLSAIKLDFRPQKIIRDKDHSYRLVPHPKFTHGTVWISDDKYRLPLRIEVDIFIGYVFGELKNATFSDGTVLP